MSATAQVTPPEAKPSSSPAALLDVQAVAALLSCSARHVWRLADSGRMPSPVRLGAAVRWSRRTVEEWVENGCPPVRKAAR